MKTSFSNTKIVNLPVTRNDAYGFFEAVALAGMEGQWMRVSAKQQRACFGNVPFGRASVRVENTGRVSVRYSQDFGRDFDIYTGNYSFFDKAWYQGSQFFPNNKFSR